MDNFNMAGNNNSGMGVYTNQSQFELDPVQLASLGFSNEEVQTLQYIVANGGKTSLQALTQYGMSYEQAKKLRYMYDICIGKVIIESTNDLCKHLKKMFGGSRKISVADLAVSKVKTVPRKAVVAGITDSTFKIYNSAQYKINEKLYDVENVTTTRIQVITNRKPVLKYKQDKFIPDVVEILDLKKDGNVVVSFNKKYAKLLNRFVIVASLRRPQFYHGLIEIICIEGTKVYVYAKTIGVGESVNYNMGTERVYAYGYFPGEIGVKIKATATDMYKRLCGVYAEVIPGNQEFNIMPIEEDKDDDDIEIED